MKAAFSTLLCLVLLALVPARAQEMVPIPRPGKDTAKAPAARAPAPTPAPPAAPASPAPSTPAPGARPAAPAGNASPATPAAPADPAPAPAGPASPGPGAAAPASPVDTAAAAAALAPDTASAAADTAKDDTVSYSAARIRYRNDRFSLSEKALLTYKGSSMVADSIVYYSKENLVEAMGAPLITDAQNPPILGYKMRYNLKTKVGEIYYGSSKKGNQSFNGVEVRRQENGAIYIARGDFSTCDLPEKHYYFYSRRMILEPQAKVLSGPIVMDIAEVPVAVLPMMVMPLGTGRRSGLLQPKFGGDQSQGFYMNNLGYYWAINDYSDWVLSADVVEGERGTFDQTNLNTNYRYNVRYLLSGALGGKYYISEFDPSRAGWHVDYANDWTITPDGKQKLVGSGRFVSAPTVVSDNALNEDERAQQTANADLGYRRQFDRLGASLNLGFNQNYNLTTENLERSVPDVTFNMGGPLFPASADEDSPAGGLEEDPWWRKLEFTYRNRANVFQRRTPGTATLAGDTATFVGYNDALSFSGKFQALQYLNITPSVNFAQQWSLYSRDTTEPDGRRVAWDPGTGDLGEYFPNFNTQVQTDTRIYGIAQAADRPWFGAVQGVRHTVVPAVGFTYAPEIDSNPRFLPNPRLGGTAYQAEQRTVNLSLGNEVDLKLGATADTSKAPASGAAGAAPKKSEPYKLASSSSTLNYNFAAQRREWSDINSSFTVYFTRNIPFTVSAVHALYDDFAPGGTASDALTAPILKSYGFSWRKGLQVGGDFSSGARVRDTRGFPGARFEKTPWSADLGYSFTFGSQRVGGGDEDPVGRFFGIGGVFQHTRTHTANGGLKLNPTAGWQMSYDTDYDFSAGRFSRHAFAFRRVLHCWDMDFRWNPVGLSEGWNFVIRITDLPDVKLESSDTKTRRVRR